MLKGYVLTTQLNIIYDLFIGFSHMRYQIKDVVKYFKMVLTNFNFPLIYRLVPVKKLKAFYRETH